MACCGKRRKPKINNLVRRRAFESGVYKILIKLKRLTTSGLNNTLLLQHHDQTHALYKGAVRFKPPNKVFINEVVDLHNEYMNEMIKRKMEHLKSINKF